jgi:hypothetical protein
MSEVSHGSTGDEVTLGVLLALLHCAADSFRTVQATYRIWRHDERIREAARADAEKLKRRGGSFVTGRFVGGGDSAPLEAEETLRIWRDGQRFREERHGGRRDGYYGVADGRLWWFWDESMGPG